MLPTIRAYAKGAFARLNPDRRQDLTQEVIANALVAYVRLWQQGRVALAYPTVLAKYAVAQIKDGRLVGGHMNVKDISSPYCQRVKGVVMERLDHYDSDDECWQEILIEDRTAGPAEIASTRIDFDAWMQALPRRERKIAEYLSAGNRTADAAKKFHCSDGRISQIRRELQQSWNDFTGGNEANAA